MQEKRTILELAKDIVYALGRTTTYENVDAVCKILEEGDGEEIMLKNLGFFAPKCAFPACDNKVSYHSKSHTDASGLKPRWKTCCQTHRNSRKWEIDEWKMSVGCQNPDCKCTSFAGPEQLSIDHVSGSKHDSDEVQILCLNCHATKTKTNGDHFANDPIQPETYDTFL